jgi:hypothetical protein
MGTHRAGDWWQRGLTRQAVADETRPSIEVYRHRDEIDLLLPVRG